MEKLQKENDKLTEKLLQEAEIKEKIMIESKTDKEVFASMKKQNEEITQALEQMSSQNAQLKT